MYSVIEAPRQSDLMIELIKKLKPQVVVVTGIAHFEAVTTSAFEHLLNITGKIGSCLFLDISDHFELSSIPVSNGVLKYLSGTPLPSHAAVICGLVKNQRVCENEKPAEMISFASSAFLFLIMQSCQLLRQKTPETWLSQKLISPPASDNLLRAIGTEFIWLKRESSAKFLKANIVNIPTHSEFGFKPSEKIFTGGPEYDIEGCGGWDLEGSLGEIVFPF
ncbi:Methionine S-methyltransferase [Vitis vinifera]|uniref:Methionine S-methyltransferase n=1 Tax=Vitis vinifera TaxID=29760 RepID=A0A438E953_VITVI|nr:Methionine S-methyltransferase [Vitis vinifera]